MTPGMLILLAIGFGAALGATATALRAIETVTPKPSWRSLAVGWLVAFVAGAGGAQEGLKRLDMAADNPLLLALSAMIVALLGNELIEVGRTVLRGRVAGAASKE